VCNTCSIKSVIVAGKGHKHMGTLHEFAVSTASFFVLVVFMVVFHELGHFMAAKALRVRVEAFSVGFGPRLFHFKYGDTEYKLCLLPLGGYVKMTGERPDEDQPLDDPGAFCAHPRWHRMLIGAAGPAANILLAFVLMTVYYAAFNETPKLDIKATTVDWVMPHTPAAEAGFQTGDVIQKFDTAHNPDWMQIQGRAILKFGQVVPVSVLRDGKSVNFSLRIPKPANVNNFDFNDVGLLPQITNDPIVITGVEPSMPAAEAGFENGDKLISVDGLRFHWIGTLLPTWNQTRASQSTSGCFVTGQCTSCWSILYRQETVIALAFMLSGRQYKKTRCLSDKLSPSLQATALPALA
jgi:regulator of sigma E protease